MSADDSTGVRREPSRSAWEQSIGSARAVAVGDLVLVAGSKPAPNSSVPGEDEPYQQAVSAFETAVASLEPFGLGADSVVRTRMYISHSRDADEVGRAHREIFRDVLPAATIVLVAGFVDSRILVEVEIEAFRGGSRA